MDEAGSTGWKALHDAALRLKASANACARPGAELPPLLFLTDPARTPQPWITAGQLPRGSGVVYRAFGAADAVATGLRLAAVCRAHGLVLLAGADAALARAIGAQGVHLPERMASQARALRAREPGWLITAAAHDAAAVRAAAAAGADAVIVSPVFDSASPSAGPALGLAAFTALVEGAAVPVYALGGINEKTAPELLGSGAVGLAAVSAAVGTCRP